MSGFEEVSSLESTVQSAKPKLIAGAVLLGLLYAAWLLLDVSRLGLFSSGPRALLVSDPPASFTAGLWVVLPLVGLAAICRKAWEAWLRVVAHPDEPWLWSGRWNPAGARAEMTGRLRRPVQAALAFSVLSLGLAFATWLPVERGGLPHWLRVPAVLIAVVVWGRVAVEAVGALRFGASFFRFSSFPFFLGERVRGELEGLSRLRDLTKLTVRLRCVEWTARASGKGSVCRVLYEVEKRFAPGDIEFGAWDGATFPVDFSLPSVVEGSRFGSASRSWELAVVAERPGPDYKATFDIPVYERRGG